MVETAWWKATLFQFSGNSYSVLDLVVIALIFIVGFWVAGSFKKVFFSEKMEKRIKNRATRTMLGNFGRYGIIVITFFIALETLGVDLTSLTVIAGALSVGIGFGLQNIVNNLISGIILMMEGSVKVGDMVELDPNTVGTVEEIRLRSTVVRTFNKVEIVVPNGDLVSNRVTNLTLSNSISRLTVPFGVAYGTKVEDVRKVVLEAVSESGLNYLKDGEYQPTVRMSAMGASSVDFILLVHVDLSGEFPLTSDFLIVVYNALNRASITIPFPQMDVHLQKS